MLTWVCGFALLISAKVLLELINNFFRSLECPSWYLINSSRSDSTMLVNKLVKRFDSEVNLWLMIESIVDVKAFNTCLTELTNFLSFVFSVSTLWYLLDMCDSGFNGWLLLSIVAMAELKLWLRTWVWIEFDTALFFNEELDKARGIKFFRIPWV